MKYLYTLFLLAIISLFVVSCHKNMIEPEPPIVPSGFPRLELKWEEQLDPSGRSDAIFWPPKISNGLLVYDRTFSPHEGIVQCRDTETGQLRWTFTEQNPIVTGEFLGPPQIYMGKVMVNTGFETNVLDLFSGNIIWRTTTEPNGEAFRGAMIAGNHIYHQHNQPSQVIPPDLHLVRTRIDALSWDTLYSTTQQENNGYNSMFGEYTLWIHPDSGDSILLFNHGLLNFSTGDGKDDLVAYNLNRQKEQWRIKNYSYPKAKGRTYKPITIDGDRAYAMGFINFHCIDLKQGKILWSKNYNDRDTTGSSEYLGFASPIIHGNMVIVMPAMERVFAYDKITGQAIWTQADPDKWNHIGATTPVIFRDWFIYTCGSATGGRLIIRRLSDGAVIHEYGQRIFKDSPVALDPDRGLVIASNFKKIFCFKIVTE